MQENLLLEQDLNWNRTALVKSQSFQLPGELFDFSKQDQLLKEKKKEVGCLKKIVKFQRVQL